MNAAVARGVCAAQTAVVALARGAPASSLSSLGVVVDDCPSLAPAYGRVATCVRALLGVAQLHDDDAPVRLSCPACGVAFLAAAPAGFRKLTLVEACAHCDARLEELQRHLDGQSYPKDAREVTRSQRLAKLEEELEHVRHLAGLAHPTTVRWERQVADEALLRGQVERARGLLTRAARASVRFDDEARAAVHAELACLALAEGRLEEAERSLEVASGPAWAHLRASVRAALGRLEEARDGLVAVASSCGWPDEVVTAQLDALSP